MATMMAVPVQQYQQPMCLQCNTKPRHFDGAKLHDFCGRTCALTYAAANGGPPGMPMQPPGFNANPNAGQFAPMQQQQMPQMQMQQQQPAPTGASSGMPQYPPQQMQQQPQQQSPTSPQMGQPSVMMQQAPMQQQMQQPMQQMQQQPFQGSPFCGMGCRKKAMAKAPGLLEIPSNHPKFQDVANQFNAKWVGSPTPTVKAVYMVLISENDTKKYEAYKAKIEAKNQHAARGREPGNQQRRWHGTTRVCTLGENGNSTLCTATNCALCNIIRSSFDMKYASRGLFGVGIYTSATPSKSNGYIAVAPGSSARPVLLNKVVVGKGYNVNQISSHFTAAPAGYDSVLGQLAADELIVYTNDAIRPAYLIMFA
ncbi:hypothetical protein FRC19_006215 [Serendipita sp. 401]|nr:hypothetical protein FRC19_006215 [Serendipita sp. 401]